MRGVELGVMVLLALMVLLFVVRPLVRRIMCRGETRPAARPPAVAAGPYGMRSPAQPCRRIARRRPNRTSAACRRHLQPHLEDDRHRPGAGPGARPIGAEGRRTRRQESARNRLHHPPMAARTRGLNGHRERATDHAGQKKTNIANLVATLAGRQTRRRRRTRAAHRPGARRGADAGARRAVRREDLELLDDDELRELSIVMSTLGTVEAQSGRGPAARIRRPAVGLRRADRQLRRDRAAAAAIPAARARLRHHGRDPRPRRPQHVGEALQRAGGGARELPQERIPADRRGRAVQDPARACRARARRSCPRTSRSTSSTACSGWKRCRRT